MAPVVLSNPQRLGATEIDDDGDFVEPSQPVQTAGPAHTNPPSEDEIGLFNRETEERILAAIIQNPAQHWVDLPAMSIQDPQNVKLYALLWQRRKDGRPITYSALKVYLDKPDADNDAKTMSYLLQSISTLSTIDNDEYSELLRIIMDPWLKRSLLESCQPLAVPGTSPEGMLKATSEIQSEQQQIRECYRRIVGGSDQEWVDQTFAKYDITAPDTTMQWRVGQVIGKGTVGIIFGPPQSGKSFAVAQLALQIAGHESDTTKSWLGWPVFEHERNVLYYINDGNISDLENRLRQIARHLKVNTDGVRIILWQGPLKEWVHNIDRAFDMYDPVLVIIDGLLYANDDDSDENSASDTREVGRILRDMANRGASVIALHHPKKNVDHEMELSNLRGSGAWAGMLDWSIEWRQREHKPLTPMFDYYQAVKSRDIDRSVETPEGELPPKSVGMVEYVDVRQPDGQRARGYVFVSETTLEAETATKTPCEKPDPKPEDIMEANHPYTRPDLMNMLRQHGVTKNRAEKMLSDWRGAGYILQEGNNRQGNVKYALNPNPPAIDSYLLIPGNQSGGNESGLLP